MKANISTHFKSNYHIELIDGSTGKVKQSGDFHNIPTWRTAGVLAGHFSTGTIALPSSIPTDIMRAIACGRGTLTPKVSDNGCTVPIWTKYYDTGSVVLEWLDDYTLKSTRTYTFPATAEYVGTITEVAVGYNFDYYATHALLTDSEGQPIAFTKSDTDILIITVSIEASLGSSDPSFVVYPRPFILRILFGDYTQEARTSFGKVHLGLYDADNTYKSKYNPSWIPGPIGQEVSSTLYTTVTDETPAASIFFNTSRLPSTAVTDQHFFNSLGISSVGYWSVPNEDTFPTYTIQNVSIGTGDGSTRQFTNPFNYFKKDTEKVYKNGGLLTRGVDYTISHMGNKDALLEIAQMVLPIRVYSDEVTSSTAKVSPMWKPSTISGSSGVPAYSVDNTVEAVCFSSDNPLYFEYDEPVTMNCFSKRGQTVALTASSTVGHAAHTLYLDFSTDGESYIQVATMSINYNVDTRAIDVDFADTTAKYWRIRTSMTNYPEAISSNADTLQYLGILRKDPYITFTEAPAENDVLSMDVDMDLIMKSSNYVVDVSGRIDMTF